jgi:WD40 repeat protein
VPRLRTVEEPLPEGRMGFSLIQAITRSNTQPIKVHSLPVAKSTMAAELLRSYSVPAQSRSGKVDWRDLFWQRTRLEANWETGRFVKFQLPHPEHADEGHMSEVYAIQLSRRYLVSGGRDKTIRIWNLDTQKLARKPLLGP